MLSTTNNYAALDILVLYSPAKRAKICDPTQQKDESVQNKFLRYVSLKFQTLISREWFVCMKWFYHQIKEELFVYVFIQCTILLLEKYDY